MQDGNICARLGNGLLDAEAVLKWLDDKPHITQLVDQDTSDDILNDMAESAMYIKNLELNNIKKG